MFQRNDAPVYKKRIMKTWCGKVGVEQLNCPAQNAGLNPTEHLWVG